MIKDCIFCKIISREIPANILKEDQDIIVVSDISPKATIHELIIPKKHISSVSELDSSDANIAQAMFLMAKERSQDHNDCAYKLIINNGSGVGQTVFHLHMHFLAGAIKGTP